MPVNGSVHKMHYNAIIKAFVDTFVRKIKKFCVKVLYIQAYDRHLQYNFLSVK